MFSSQRQEYLTPYICVSIRHMIKDIPIRKVEDVVVAIMPQAHDPEAATWEVYLINLKSEPITNVLVASKGYGQLNGEPVNTSVLRHFFEEVPSLSYRKVEQIQTKVFALNNEYMVTFTYDDFLFDKKYTFTSGSIDEGNFTQIPLINRVGVMIG
jgi:hypothetical protein